MGLFTGKEAALEQAMAHDNVGELRAAVQAGANVNARGRHNVTPLEYAAGQLKKESFLALLAMKADYNLRDDDGDTAVTLAQRAFTRDPSYLEAVLKAGANPNTRDQSNDPLLENFVATSNKKGILLLQQYHVNLNDTQRDGIPIIVNAAGSQYWISVLQLLQLGARYDYQGVHGSMADGFRHTEIIDRKSERFQARRASWQFLHDKGFSLPPLQEPLQ